ncbi:hypothetical protein RJ639_005902 [Escallonia herrerae]|uniref:Cytochrome P450 n=1 Tax=Escallonia herrerae TaxID=1293975 RepID=A0AA88VX78_9ASTE|nr:hypothetical protein RJ639_005902 [Escallonia herrerae]
MVEMKLVFFELMMNVMMSMIAGTRYYGEKVREADEACLFREIVTEMLIGGRCEEFVGFLAGFEVVLSEGVGEEGLVEEQRRRLRGGLEAEEGKKTMMEVLVEMQEKEPESYTDEVIKGLVLNNALYNFHESYLGILAVGTVSTIRTTEWALILMLNNPELTYLSPLHYKLDTEGAPGRPSTDTKPVIRGVQGRRFSRTMLLVNMWAVQNNMKKWEDLTEFKPEWIEGLEGTRDGFKLAPFGYGRRACPGEGLGMRMIGLAWGRFFGALIGKGCTRR